MMTKRSNHMPTLTRIEIGSNAAGLERRRRSHNNCGTHMLQTTIVQNAQAYGPAARLTKVKRSTSWPPYHADIHSLAYEKATIEPVNSVTLAIRSRCAIVM